MREEFLNILPNNENLIPFNIKLFKVDKKGEVAKISLSQHNHFNYYNIPTMQLKA